MYDPSECDGPKCNLVVFTERTRTTGDSGGPVYFAGQAHGIHHGKKMVDGQYRDLFSRADRLFDAIEIYISTN